MDPAKQFFSPYVGMGNNPVIYGDPNGETIIYVNGLVAPGGSALASYWNVESGNFVQKFNSVFDDNSNLFANGDKSLTPAIRELQGAGWALENIDAIMHGIDETGQLILVSHSKGGAFANGIAQQLEHMGVKVDLHVALAPFQDDVINTGNIKTNQYMNSGDWVSGSKPNFKGNDVNRFTGTGKHFLTTFSWVFGTLGKTPSVEVGPIIYNGIVPE